MCACVRECVCVCCVCVCSVSVSMCFRQVATSNVSHANSLQKALWTIVEQLEVRYDMPGPECKLRNEQLISHTFLRREAHVKGGLDHGGGTRATAPSERMQHATNSLLQMLNGDWRSPRLIHHCFNCDVCRGSVATAREHVFAALLACDVLSVRCTRTPSQKDWGSCTDHCAKQCLGILCHRVLPQTMGVAFPDWGAMEPPVDPAAEALDGPGYSFLPWAP